MNIVTILGARPQFIKAAPVSRTLRRYHKEILVHTGQHYDEKMSAIFFSELGIPKPNYNLKVGSGNHGWQTGKMLERIEDVLLNINPDWVLVYGDTNSTLAGSLAAAKLHIPVAHVEAGLRSFNRDMAEEHNRVLTDHCSDLLLCPTQTAVDNLKAEGITNGVHLVGDVMMDAAHQFGKLARERSKILRKLNLTPKQYILATIHRAYNTDIPGRLQNIIRAFSEINKTVVFTVHPRTRKQLRKFELHNMVLLAKNIRAIEPVGYLDMLKLEQSAQMILTDSGGIQKEAFFFAVPCLTLRPETEWVETVEVGWNQLVDVDIERIVDLTKDHNWPEEPPPPLFGEGRASQKIAHILENGKTTN